MKDSASVGPSLCYVSVKMQPTIIWNYTRENIVFDGKVV